jgi:serine/threonine protein kinase/Tfp pilus assembly protein PilF
MDSYELADLSAAPSTLQRLSHEQKDRLTDILDRYLSARESGLPPQREKLLAEHPDLAGPLETYLDSLDELHDAAAGFAGPAPLSPAETDTPESDGKRLGDFELLREIGRGGMGVVYEARQVSLGRRVALKVLPFAAVLDSKQIARFKNEAQAAAQLDHPGIVSVFAVGVERGVHYYAMQFVDGQPLDRAIAELRSTAGRAPSTARGNSAGTVTEGTHDSRSTAAAEGDEAGGVNVPVAEAAQAGGVCPSTCRSFLTAKSTNRHEYFRTVVRLGIQAAEALQAAHEYGVVHRDVKPSNLLLDADGKLWVTDFGLARFQTDAALTRTGDLVGTTRYMSPEQARGQSALVDQRTDVYSLGATLYELLALEPAFPGEDGPGLLRRIDQQEPRPLRQLEPKLPADLETVVRKAMAKSREERYTTARELADDLRRVLEGKPTVARPPTVPERIGKWARRHKRIVFAATAVSLFVALGMAAATVLIAREKARTEQSYRRAESYFREAQEAVDSCIRSAERLSDVPGADQVRSELLQDTLGYYLRFVDQAEGDVAVQADLALTYNKIGTLAGEVGSTGEAVEAHENARRLFEQLVADHPHEDEYRARLGVCRNNLALVLRRTGRTEDARRELGEAIRLQKEIVGRSPDSAQYRSDLATSYNNLGLLQSDTGEAADAGQSFREAIRLQEPLVDAEPDNPEHLGNLAASLNNLSALYASEDPARAAELYQKALAYQTKAAAAKPGELKYRSDAALTYNNLGAVQARAEKLPEAAASYGRAIEIQRELVRAAPAHRSYRRDLAVSCSNLALTQSRLGRPSQAEQSFREACDLQEALVRENPNDVDLQSTLGGIYNNLGIVLEDLQRIEEAAETYKKAVEHQQIAYSHAPEVSRYRLFLSKHDYNYGRVLRRLNRPDEAARAALARKELWPNDPERLFAVAEELALASRLLAAGPRGGMTSDECAGLAVETLRQAAAAGWKPELGLASTASFAALKNQAGFAELLGR